MNTPPSSQSPRSIRIDAGLDVKTRAKLKTLASAFQRSRAAVPRQVVRWGLAQPGPMATRVPRRLTSFFFMVDAELHRQVKAAAQAAGVDVAPWLRQWPWRNSAIRVSPGRNRPRSAHSGQPEQEGSMRRILYGNGLPLVLFGLFVLCVIGQSLAGRGDDNDERRAHGLQAVNYGAYLRTGHFLEALAENWESEFLQMGGTCC